MANIDYDWLAFFENKKQDFALDISVAARD
jgi:hypothetical protein